MQQRCRVDQAFVNVISEINVESHAANCGCWPAAAIIPASLRQYQSPWMILSSMWNGPRSAQRPAIRRTFPRFPLRSLPVPRTTSPRGTSEWPSGSRLSCPNDCGRESALCPTRACKGRIAPLPQFLAIASSGVRDALPCRAVSASVSCSGGGCMSTRGSTQCPN